MGEPDRDTLGVCGLNLLCRIRIGVVGKSNCCFPSPLALEFEKWTITVGWLIAMALQPGPHPHVSRATSPTLGHRRRGGHPRH
jgi:hypothetical protein